MKLFVEKIKRINEEIKTSHGFTLIEMLMVVTIIGILAAVVLPRMRGSQETAKREAFNATKYNINNQLETYYYLKGGWPVGDSKVGTGPLTDWTDEASAYWPDGVPVTDNYGTAWKITNGRVDTTVNQAP